MENLKKTFSVVGLAFLVIILGVYMSGNRITIESRSSSLTAQMQMGQGKGTPGWRNPAASGGTKKGDKAGQKNQFEAPPPGSGGGGGGQGTGQGVTVPGARPGSGMGGGPGRMAGGGGQVPGAQPGFGPSGGILLPIKLGEDSVPVVVDGKEVGSFVGKDLMDNVEDTVIATAKGPRKGWGVGKTLSYFGVKELKEVALFDRNGKRTTINPAQVKDDQTFVLFTYNEDGVLLLSSGPKVRGTNKGKTSVEQVIQMVEGRKDLLAVPDVVKIEVKS